MSLRSIWGASVCLHINFGHLAVPAREVPRWLLERKGVENQSVRRLPAHLVPWNLAEERNDGHDRLGERCRPDVSRSRLGVRGCAHPTEWVRSRSAIARRSAHFGRSVDQPSLPQSRHGSLSQIVSTCGSRRTNRRSLRLYSGAPSSSPTAEEMRCGDVDRDG